MKALADLIACVLIIVGWLAGIVIAKGFWSVLFAICLPPYAWYLLVEWVMRRMGS